MMKMFSSIKNRLIFLFSLLLLFIVFIVVSFYWYEGRKNEINDISLTLKNINYNIKDARNLEKDFSIYETINPTFYETGNSQYLREYKLLMDQVEADLNRLQANAFISDSKTSAQIDSVFKYLSKHEEKFNRLVVLIKTRGFKDYGLIGEMREYIHEVENADFPFDNAKLLTIRGHEKDYLLGNQSRYIELLDQATNELIEEAENKDYSSLVKKEIINSLNRYNKTFHQLVSVDRNIGYYAGAGLKSEVEVLADKVQKEVDDLNDDILNVRQQMSQNIKFTFLGILIMGILLNILLIFFVINRLGNPIKKLNQSIKSIISGNFLEEAQIETICSSDELGSLSENFALMLSRLKKRNTEILQQKDQVTKAYNNIKVLSEIGKSIMSNLSLEAIIKTVYSNINKFFDTSFFIIGLYDPEKQGINYWGIRNHKEVFLQGFDPLVKYQYLSTYCFNKKKDVYIYDYKNQYNDTFTYIHSSIIMDTETQSMICVPLMFNDKNIGVMTIKNYRKNAYTENHFHLMKNLANYVSIAIENYYSCNQISRQKEELIEQSQELKQAHEEILVSNEALEQHKEEITAQRDEILSKQRTIQNSEEKYKMLIENLNNVIFALDKDLTFTYLSPSIEKLLEYHPSEFNNQPFSSIVYSEDKEEIQNNLESYVKKTAIPGVNEFRLFRKSGEPLWVSVQFRRIMEDSVVSGIQGVITNIQERKKAEEKVKAANDKILEQQKSITDSIYYARRIQRAVLPRDAFVKKVLPEHFVLYKPKDIVSGDFYWVVRKAATVLIAVADCTGHGVPGAFMSMLGVSLLNDALSKNLKRFFEGNLKASDMVEELRKRVKKSLRQSSQDALTKDGMDLAFCIIDFDTNYLQYSGAYNPLLIIRNGELIKLKATRNPVGIYIKEKPFENHEMQLQEGDRLYMFSDGYIDQFGGENNEKFMTKNFQNLLLDIYDKPMAEQKQILEETFIDWMGDYEQVDDIVVLGFKI